MTHLTITSLMFVALALAAPTMLLVLRRGMQPKTASVVRRGIDRRF